MRGRQIAAGALAGWLFGLGLAVSGMMNPARVIGFLDVGRLFTGGVWDPTLGFVMGGALLVTAPGFAWLRHRRAQGIGAPLWGDAFHWPTRRDIDGRLILGALLFGVGWGLIGFCPGPALAALSTGATPVLIFAAAMAAGMMLYGATAGRR